MGLAPLGPSPTGVEHIPRRALLLVSAFTRVVISEPVENPVPQRREHLNHQRLAQRNPDVVHHQITASEIFDPKILRLADGFRMFVEALKETISDLHRGQLTFAGTFWHGLTNVDCRRPPLFRLAMSLYGAYVPK